MTCVTGNTHVDNVLVNVLRIADLMGCKSVPVFRGAEEPLVHKYACAYGPKFFERQFLILEHLRNLLLQRRKVAYVGQTSAINLLLGCMNPRQTWW